MRVVSSSEHLLSLINDILDMSKIKAGALTLHLENNIDISALAASVIDSLEGQVQAKGIVMVRRLAPEMPLITGDRRRLIQVILNILVNAIKFTEKGSITIQTSVTEYEIRIMVQDTGMGIAPEEYDAVFQPFGQSETGRRHEQGTGLGMPIAKSLVEAHGGQIWFESVIGQGTTFYVTLPYTLLE